MAVAPVEIAQAAMHFVVVIEIVKSSSVLNQS